MTKNEFMVNYAAMIDDASFREFLMSEAERIVSSDGFINSGASMKKLDPDNQSLPQLVLTVALMRLADRYAPRTGIGTRTLANMMQY